MGNDLHWSAKLSASPQHHPHVLKMSCKDFRKVVFIVFKAPFRCAHGRSGSSLIISGIRPCPVHVSHPTRRKATSLQVCKIAYCLFLFTAELCGVFFFFFPKLAATLYGSPWGCTERRGNVNKNDFEVYESIQNWG